MSDDPFVEQLDSASEDDSDMNGYPDTSAPTNTKSGTGKAAPSTQSTTTPSASSTAKPAPAASEKSPRSLAGAVSPSAAGSAPTIHSAAALPPGATTATSSSPTSPSLSKQAPTASAHAAQGSAAPSASAWPSGAAPAGAPTAAAASPKTASVAPPSAAAIAAASSAPIGPSVATPGRAEPSAAVPAAPAAAPALATQTLDSLLGDDAPSEQVDVARTNGVYLEDQLGGLDLGSGVTGMGQLEAQTQPRPDHGTSHAQSSMMPDTSLGTEQDMPRPAQVGQFDAQSQVQYTGQAAAINAPSAGSRMLSASMAENSGEAGAEVSSTTSLAATRAPLAADLFSGLVPAVDAPAVPAAPDDAVSTSQATGGVSGAGPDLAG
jgi:hypothetical protein